MVFREEALFFTSATATSARGQVRPRHTLRQTPNVILQCRIVSFQLIVVALDRFDFLNNGVEAILELGCMAVWRC